MEALAKAIEGAAAAGRFDVVAQLAKELEARRLARAGTIVALDAKGRRGGDREPEARRLLLLGATG